VIDELPPHIARSPEFRGALLQEYLRRKGKGGEASVLSQMTPPQRAVYDDKSKNRALLCGSRAGKTIFNALDLSASMGQQQRRCHLFLSLSRDQARNIIWQPWKDLNDKLGLGLYFHDHVSIVEHMGTHSYTLIRGSDTKREIDKYRGVPTQKVKVDETQAFRPAELEYLVESVLTPRTMDYGGVIDLSGTPGYTPHGYWYEVSTGRMEGWSQHAWTALQNPHVNAAEFFAEIRRRRKWTDTNPIYRREYLGEWVLDLDALAFAFVRDRNVIHALPELPSRLSRWRYVLAIDYGVVHTTAWCVLAYREGSPIVYVVESFRRKLGEDGATNAPSEVADITRRLIEKYRPQTVVGDLGGLGKGYAQEMLLRHQIAIRPARKDHKLAAVEVTSDALRTGHLLSLRGNESLHRELETVQWDEKHQDLAKGQQDDEAMALAYAYRETPAFAERSSDTAIGPRVERDPHDDPEYGDPQPETRRYDDVEDF
jgi:hypothetical protein